MGSLAGHLLPGTFFILFAVWWSFVTAIRYIQSKHYLSAKKSKANYVSQTTMPCICLPSESLRRSPVESYLRLTASLIGILGEFITAIDFNHVVEPGIGKDDISIFGCDNQSSHVHMHKRDTHPHIQPFYFARNNLQHITMYSAFVLQALVEILLYKGFSLPKRSDFYFGLIAYSIEAFLFAFHLHSRAPMDIHVHVLLVYAIIGCCLSICLEIYNPHQVMFTYGRILFTMLQGTWFWQAGFVLYPPMDVEFLKWNRCDHKQIMIITTLFCWHLLLISLGLLVQLCFLNKFYYSSKRVRDRFDELILIQDEWERKSVQLQTAQNGLSETRFFMLDSDEDEVYDNNKSSPVSSTSSGNYSVKSSQMSNFVNANDAESGGSDESDVDFDLEDLDSENEYLVSDYSSDDECESEFDEPIECSSDQQPPSGQSRNLDKTSKAGVHWTKLDDGDETCIRKRIVFNEKSGPTSFAASRIDSTALSAFLVIFDLCMVKMVLDCTNAFAESVNPFHFYEDKNGIVLTVYQGKVDKNVSVLTTYHEKVSIDKHHQKSLPNVIDDYNRNKVGVDCVDSMTRLYTPKAQTRRWPVHVFFNIQKRLHNQTC